MKNLLLIIILLLFLLPSNAQNLYVSDNQLKTLDGSNVRVESVLSQTGTILVFWETSNSRCSSNLENLQEAWAEEVKSLGVKLVGICVGKPGYWPAVKPIVAGKGWEFDVYIDPNGDLRRAFGITTVPYTVLIDGEQNIKCRYAGYCSGDESQICEKIINCLQNHGTLAEF
jgi:cytochrome c biogenesis protein CcmG, thiol:disulfide interchange protein DsbE